VPDLPLTPDDIDPNRKVNLGRQYRGTGVGQAGNLNQMMGDLGRAVYLTPHEWLAATYGGGPQASVAKGTRVVTPYNIAPLFPEDVGYIFNGAQRGSNFNLFSGGGVELARAPWSIENMENVLSKHDLKAIVGTPQSIGVNQLAVRDPSIIQPAGGGPLPLMAPRMVGHPVGLRDREREILSRFEND
jgi:hypothetical protein